MSIDKNNRQRGNDEADAPLLVERDESAKDVDVVIGAVKSNQSNNKAADELEAALGVESKEPAAALLGFWRNLSVLAGTGVDKPTVNSTIAHSTDRPGSTTHSTSVRQGRAKPRPGEEVGQRFQFNQLSVSHNQRKCAQAFGVELRTAEAKLHGLGDPLGLKALADLPSLALPEVAYPQMRHRLEHVCARNPEIRLVT